MPFVDSNGVRIHYEIEGDGPPLVLLHGNLSDIQWWRDLGYVDALKDRYRLILIDQRGFGESDKPHAPEAYTRPSMVADVSRVLDAERIDRAIFWGFSMGGSMCFSIAEHAPERIEALVIGGASGMNTGTPAPTVAAVDKGIDVVVKAFEANASSAPYAHLVLRNDIDALRAFARAEALSLEHVHATMRMPCLMYAGDQDPSNAAGQAVAKKMLQAEYVSLPGLDHLDGFCLREASWPHVTAFLDRVTAGVREHGGGAASS